METCKGGCPWCSYSVSEMESSGAEVSMNIELTRMPRRKEPINVLTGIFLKRVYFLDPELTKCVIAGFFKNRGDCLGVLFKGKRGSVFWSVNILNKFFVHFNEVTLALDGKQKYYFSVETGEDIKVVSVFGKQHVFLYDGEHTLALNAFEWSQFTNSVRALYTYLGEVILFENLIKDTVREIVESDVEVPVSKNLPPWLGKHLLEEVLLYKRWPNGGSG